MTVTERCSCGAERTVTSDYFYEINMLLEEFRRAHVSHQERES